MRNLAWTTIVLAMAACSDRRAPAPPDAEALAPVQVVSASTANGATPMFLVTDAGARVLSWVAAADGGTEGVLHVQVAVPGATDSVRSVLTDPLGGIEPHGEAPPQVAAAGDGSLYVLYTVGRDVGERFPRSALRFARSADGGRTWSAPVTINEGEEFGSHNFHSVLAGPGGAVYASWLSSVHGVSGVWLRVSKDGGATWAPARAIHEAPSCPCCRTGLALASDGSLYVSWRKIFAGDVRDVVVMRSTDDGATWSAPVKPRDDGWVFPGCPHAGPSMRVGRDGAVHIAWWTGRAGAAGIWYARSADRGVTWSAVAIDTATKSSPAHVQLALDDRTGVVVAWDDGKGVRPSILVRASRDGGTSFGGTLQLSDPAVAASFPVLGVRGDSVTVAWSQTGDSAYRASLHAHPARGDTAARMALPRVGQQEVLARSVSLAALSRAPR